jgi:hypothetical protein
MQDASPTNRTDLERLFDALELDQMIKAYHRSRRPRPRNYGVGDILIALLERDDDFLDSIDYQGPRSMTYQGEP